MRVKLIPALRSREWSLFCLYFFCMFYGQMLFAQDREPVVAGAFYPSSPDALSKMIKGFIENAQISKNSLPSGELVGLICPHAGYPYSGPVAGYSYKLLEGLKFDTVVILGVNHKVWGFKDISVWNSGCFKTPFGEIEVDKEFADSIINENPKKYIFYPDAQREEHSIEVQLPFLQMVLKDFKLVPIVMSDYSKITCSDLANVILKNKGNRKILVIASTDLSHDSTYDIAANMDKLGLGYAENLDIENLTSAESNGKTEMCGFGPVLTLLYMARNLGNVKGVLLKYANSGDTTGDRKGRIVGYGAVAFYKEDESMSEDVYTLDEKKELLKLARDTIINHLSKKKTGQYPVYSKKFKELRGVFVTLHKHGELRGCIGYIEPVKPLYQAVVDNVVNSATQDPRFPQVRPDELPDIEIEISVLTAPLEISGPGEFITGKHGIIIRKGSRSAVFLPQVAPEQGWTREETLSHLCMKAGLSPDEWQKQGMRFFVFTADVFSEKEIK